MVKRVSSEYLSLMMNLLLLFLLGQTGDETVLATAERLFHNGNLETAAEMISAHEWSSDSLWSRAGLFLQLSTDGFSIPLDSFQGESIYDLQCLVRVMINCSSTAGDSLRLFIPVPAVLPWQVYSDTPEVELSGIQGDFAIESGWFCIEGVSQGDLSACFSVPVSISCEVFNGSEVEGVEDAMVCFPGEDSFIDQCLDESVFWFGDDRVYLESVTLARAEPNPMRLLERVRDRIAGFAGGMDNIDQSILLIPAAVLALDGSLENSAGGVFLAAAVLRRWQIPAMVAPGRYNGGSSSGFVLFVHVKPFGWMTLSPVPGDFVTFGSSELPSVHSWPWGVPGLTVFAESRKSQSRWRSVSPDSIDVAYTVEYSPL